MRAKARSKFYSTSKSSKKTPVLVGTGVFFACPSDRDIAIGRDPIEESSIVRVLKEKSIT